MSTSSPRTLAGRLQRPDYVELVFGIVFVWGTGDLLSTFAALHFTGLWAEANPLVRTLLARDPLLVVALKAPSCWSWGSSSSDTRRTSNNCRGGGSCSAGSSAWAPASSR
ncbi:hypothetical protein ACFQER_06000 [Halomicroarcula sp. GCM10025894]|uniref:hypothetical protein n=1 Tax=Halomicroarcula sp. GCM10025894 TaxID=3252673 RepID=UPI003612637E